MLKSFSALCMGLIFGLGLTISEMIDPTKVLSFLDIAGNWDPSLMLVMGSAVIVAYIGFHFVLKRPMPILEDNFHLPLSKQIDSRLISGAGLFGIGWGLSGLCPGPALAGLALGGTDILIFFAAMLVGLLIGQLLVADGPESKELGAVEDAA